MPHESDPRFLVVHALRLKGFAEADAVARTTGLTVTSVEYELQALADEGLATRREGRVSGWSLTPAGRVEHGTRVAEDLEAAGARPVVDDAYRRFLAVNADMLAVCTAWQLREVDGTSTMNDHSDEAYDKGVLERLHAVHERISLVTDDLAERMARFGRYGERLTTALERVRAGEREWFTKPIIDSYHTVWFELHEDLLCTLGLERASEGQD